MTEAAQDQAAILVNSAGRDVKKLFGNSDHLYRDLAAIAPNATFGDWLRRHYCLVSERM